ncbi:MAG: hypothetical protein A2Y21_10050 [Clostridiales bacterium GWC2_40_7]|nr:MAG: hypothetical protein A2Y21_10050 [Clostridiales bacterium GWC2_40_7]
MEQYNQKEIIDLIKRKMESHLSRFPQGVEGQMKPALHSFNYEDRSIAFFYDVQSWMLNPGGIMHGGLIAAGFDSVMGMLAHVFSAEDEIVTVNLQITYIKPIPGNSKLLITAKISSAGRKMSFISADARCLENPNILNAAANGIYYIKSAK